MYFIIPLMIKMIIKIYKFNEMNMVCKMENCLIMKMNSKTCVKIKSIN